MPKITIVLGLVLVALGYAAYFATGRNSMLPMLPTAFGIPITLCGVLANSAHLRRGALSAAAALTLLGAFMTARPTLSLVEASALDERTQAAAMHAAAMFLLCVVYLGVMAATAKRR